MHILDRIVTQVSYFLQFVNSAFFLGYLIGSGVFGSLSDNIGRKKSLFMASGELYVEAQQKGGGDLSHDASFVA